MPKPISNDKRADIVNHMQAGENRDDIAKWLRVNVKNDFARTY